MQRSNAGVFWPVLVAIAATDGVTKRWAQHQLTPERVPHELFGDWMRLTLIYNPGAAFGLHVGQYSRWVFMGLTLVALVILWWLYRTTRFGDVSRTLALALVCGGAIGNLVDRVRWHGGVVDFIDIGIRDSRWPTFNVADMAVSIGAFVLAWVLWGEDNRAAQQAVPAQIGREPGELS
jgi:signal peptidase II